MKNYERPNLDVIYITTNDVITSSADDPFNDYMDGFVLPSLNRGRSANFFE